MLIIIKTLSIENKEKNTVNLKISTPPHVKAIPSELQQIFQQKQAKNMKDLYKDNGKILKKEIKDLRR